MKKVLIITSYYPPMGGPGCIKLVKHLKYMKNQNWQPVILTQKYNHFFAYDETLMDYVEGIPVYRFFSPDIGWMKSLFKKDKNIKLDRRWLNSKDGVSLSQKIQRFIWRNFLIPDGRIGWIIPLFLKALSIIKREKIELVYMRLPIWSMGISAALLSKFVKIPIIVDFDDEWIGFSTYFTYTKLRQGIERFLERRIVENVDLVISTGPRVKDKFMEKYPHIHPEKFRYITMGFDPDDFDEIQPERVPLNMPNNKEPFIISYLGTFHEDIEPEGYFITPYYTYQALQKIRERRPDILERLRFVVIGHLIDKLINIAEEMDVLQYMHITGYLPHKQAMSFTAGSDVLLFVLYSKGRGPRQLPAKLYEYLAMDRPILSLAPESDGADIIRETNTGIIVPPENPEAIAQAIIEIYDKDAKLDLEFDYDAIARYNQESKTNELLAIFDEMAELGKGYFQKLEMKGDYET